MSHKTEEPDAEASGEELEAVERNAAPRATRPTTLAFLAIGATAVVLAVGIGLLGGLDRFFVPPVTPRLSASVAPTRTATVERSARDSGPREFATGPATLLSRGRFHYVVQTEDTFFGIASRFHVCAYDLVSGRPIADQSSLLTSGTVIDVELGPWPIRVDGSINCVWDN